MPAAMSPSPVWALPRDRRRSYDPPMRRVASPETSGSAPICDLLLTGGAVVTVDDERSVFDPGAVAIAGDRIVAVGAAADLAGYRAARAVDCSGSAVIPGLVDCHNHLFQTLARGLGEGLGGWPWLARFMWPYAGAITPEETRAAALLGAIEAARAGTTAILDHHYGRTDPRTTLSVAAAIESVGLRGVVARGIAGPLTEVGASHGLPRSSFPYTTDEELAFTEACMEARPRDGRVVVWPGPLNLVYTDQDLVRRGVALAREAGVGWHTHCSAPRADPAIYLDAYGIRPVPWLHGEGLLGPDTTLAHCTWLDDGDIELLGETGTAAVYLPVSNQYMPYGVMRLRDLRAAGAVVGLGSDGAACGHRQDLFECMKQAVLLQRVHSLDPEAALAEEALELATREGARLLGIDAGALAPGKLADVVVVDLRRAHLRPHHRTVASLVYAARGSDVAMTIVGGRVIVEGGRCTLVSEREAIDDAQARSADVAGRANLAPLARPWVAATAGPRGSS
jgi:5-methylthioadenosine/S-adenosylhomocysteine deaminase